MPKAILKSLQSQPSTLVLVVVSIVCTLWWWSGGPIEEFITMDGRAWLGQPWRLFTSVLPHADPIHLLFNLYWLGIFGGRVEQEFGSLKVALLYFVLGVGSSVAQYALHDAGVGLSGIGYGLFGFLWYLNRTNERFADVIRPGVVQLFVVWFFVCVALTAVRIWHVGNIAHTSGAIIGVNIAYSVSAETQALRRVGWSILVATFVTLLTAGPIGRSYVNSSDNVGDELAYLGYSALMDNNPNRAIRFLTRAVQLEPRQAGWWYNLGIAYQQSSRFYESKYAYQRAHENAPDNNEFKTTLVELEKWLANEPQ